MALTNEQILQEITDAMKQNGETKKNINEALTHAQTAIRNMEKKLKAEYERGYEDAWNLARRIANGNLSGSFTSDELVGIFDTIFPHIIFDNHPTFKEANEKVKAYEEKKNKLTRGDEVIIESRISKFTGIFLCENEHHYSVIDPDYDEPQRLDKITGWKLTKTGRHVDLFGGENDD